MARLRPLNQPDAPHASRIRRPAPRGSRTVGDPASRKKKAPEPQRWRHGALLPVRVLLRDFAASLPPPGVRVADGALWTFIVGQLPAPLARYADELQRELLADGGLILVDTKYEFGTDADGQIVRDAAQLEPGSPIRVEFHVGEVDATVNSQKD